MSIAKYLAFIKASEQGSFTKAADMLGYTQSGISHMINDLEEQWGVSLLKRNPGGVHLTSDGLELLPFVREVCEKNTRLLTAVDELRGLASGLLRIGTFSSVATHWLPNIVKAFSADYPGIEFELLLGDYLEIEQWALEGRVDCGFLRLPGYARLENIFIEKDPLLVVLPENHPLAACEKFPVKELANYPFMLMEKSAKGEIAAVFEQHKINPDIRFTTWDDYAIMAMVESGMGISILPQLILQRAPYKIITKELDVPAFREIGLVMKDRNSLSLAMQRFLDYLHYRSG